MFKKILTGSSIVLATTLLFAGCAGYDATPSGNPHVLGKKAVLDSSLYPEGSQVGIYSDGSRYIDYKKIRYVGNFEVKNSCKDFGIEKKDIKYTSSTGKGTVLIDIEGDKTMLEFTETGTCHLGDIYVVKLSDKKVEHHK